jgi:transketolase
MPSRRVLADAIRVLSIDAVQAARSGHPGMPLGMADIAEVLWNSHLRHNPGNPGWINRDRFVLSNGHGSMLLYSLLHLTGYDLPIGELEKFRQLHSKTPGHPEFGLTPGVETTTGPLGQGLANAVGMAIAEQVQRARFNVEGLPIIDHHTFVFAGDGCLMEGISHEACSLAGTLGLGRLIVFYDDNGISIDGETKGWFTEDVDKRFEAYGWQVIAPVDGHNPDEIDAAILAAKADLERPTLIRCKTIIGFGSPLAGSEKSHGAPLGENGVAATRENLGWTAEAFDVPAEVRDGWNAHARGEALESAWQRQFAEYEAAKPEMAAELLRQCNGALPDDWKAINESLQASIVAESPSVATRKASQMVLETLGSALPELLGGSADLSESNNTQWSGAKLIDRDNPGNNYISYGVREFAMSAIMNGMALHGGAIPYGGTFLVFSEYARNAVRMAALMGQRVVFVYSHDSIGLGEDGPTHQAVEQTATLRMLPNLDVWRPCDALETAVAWQQVLERADGPSCLLLSRQNLEPVERGPAERAAIANGGYVALDSADAPAIVIIATGSEVGLGIEAAGVLAGRGIGVRVVSMPCVERFLAQPQSYRDQVLPRGVARCSLEAGVTGGWYQLVGSDGLAIGVDRFGESAPGGEVFSFFGLTADKVAERIIRHIDA